MKTLKIVLMQVIDLIFGLICLTLLILYLLDMTRNYTSMLTLMVGYIVYNIYNKVLIIKQYREGCEEE